MGRPFSERVAADDWYRDATTWIDEQLGEAGVVMTGPVEQPRIRPWSTQLVVPTDAGPIWFKANCRAMSFEPVFQTELARLIPEAVDQPFAIDGERGWMLTKDQGATWGDSVEATTADWRQLLTEAAHLQAVAAHHGPDLLATGLPDCRPATVVDRFDRLVDIFAGLPDRHPAHVTRNLRSQLIGARPQIVDAVDLLSASSLPITWQHGDLHPGNVFAIDGTLRIFDFGDSQWAHAAELLSVPFGWITTQTTLPWDEVLGAFAEAWGISATDLDEQLTAAGLTQPINRTLLWWSCLQEATAEEWTTWGAGPLHHLTRVLDG